MSPRTASAPGLLEHECNVPGFCAAVVVLDVELVRVEVEQRVRVGRDHFASGELGRPHLAVSEVEDQQRS